MMLTTNRIFIDSSVLIEALKGNRKDFLDSLLDNIDYEFFINDTVLSEYLYFLLGFSSGISPRTLQQKKEITNTLTKEKDEVSLLEEFRFLRGNQSFLTSVPGFISKYNLLPNDATILATCKLHKTALASHDSDFIIPGEEEDIELIRDI